MLNDFNYFDQFPSVDIDLNPYLSNIKTETGYDYVFENIQPVKIKLANIFEKFDIVIDFKKDIINFHPYTIKDSDRIETISYNEYGVIDYWWVIAIFNDIKNLFTDWPISESQLNQTAIKLYQTEGKYSRQTYYDLLFERNEKKRNILLPNANVIDKIVVKFRDAVLQGTIN